MSSQNDNGIENYDADLISLLDEDGNEYEFEILDETDYKDSHYYALMPLFEVPDDEGNSNGIYMIFEAVEDENGEIQLAELEDDDLIDELAEIFEANFENDDEYYDD